MSRPEVWLTGALPDHYTAEWHVQSKQSVLPTGGTKIVPHEVDISNFSPDNPRQLVYDENKVKSYAFPVVHTIAGAMGYRLELTPLSNAGELPMMVPCYWRKT